MKAERPMAKGLAFMVGYNYNQEYHSQYFNQVDVYNNRYHDVGSRVSRGITSRWPAPGKSRLAGGAST